jgi:hypothetical protein
MIDKRQTERLFDLYPVLAEIDRELLTRVLSRARLVTVRAGAPIFKELEPCQAVPFILAGNIRVYK